MWFETWGSGPPRWTELGPKESHTHQCHLRNPTLIHTTHILISICPLHCLLAVWDRRTPTDESKLLENLLFCTGKGVPWGNRGRVFVWNGALITLIFSYQRAGRCYGWTIDWVHVCVFHVSQKKLHSSAAQACPRRTGLRGVDSLVVWGLHLHPTSSSLVIRPCLALMLVVLCMNHIETLDIFFNICCYWIVPPGLFLLSFLYLLQTCCPGMLPFHLTAILWELPPFSPIVMLLWVAPQSSPRQWARKPTTPWRNFLGGAQVATFGQLWPPPWFRQYMLSAVTGDQGSCLIACSDAIILINPKVKVIWTDGLLSCEWEMTALISLNINWRHWLRAGLRPKMGLPFTWSALVV